MRVHSGCSAYKHRLTAESPTVVIEVRNGTSSLKPCRHSYTSRDNGGSAHWEDSTDQLAIAPREGGAVMPLTERSFAMLRLDDPRGPRRMAGAISEWEYVSSPSHAHAPLRGSPAAVTSLLYSPNEISQVASFYHNQILAPTRHQQALVQSDTGPA